MKTILSAAATIAVLAITTGTPSADASDLSQMFRVLEATQHTSAPAAGTSVPLPASAASRLLLGAWLTDCEGKLRVSGTVPGSPASQTLQPGDVLCRISVAGGRTLGLRTLHQFEYAKHQIGPHRQSALEVHRPGVGMILMNVTFETDGGMASVALNSPRPADLPAAAEGEGLVSR